MTKDTRDLHAHELRQTAASLAIASGAGAKVVQQMLGHASAAMTMDVYSHLFDDRLDEVGNALDAARGASRQAGADQEPQTAVAKVLPNADVVDLAAYRAKGKTAGQRHDSGGGVFAKLADLRGYVGPVWALTMERFDLRPSNR